MAQQPKMPPEQWAKVRSIWEMDKRTGYQWIVDEMALPVSVPAVRKTASREGWAKLSATDNDAQEAMVSQPPQRNHAKVSETMERNHAETLTPNEKEVVPYKTRETPVLDELDRDKPKVGIFVREYLKDFNGTQAAIRAGYSPAGADVHAARMLATERVRAAILELRNEHLRNIEAESGDVLRVLVNQLHADVNELSQYRRVCCRHCWGEEYRYQCTPAEYVEKKLRHDKLRAKTLKDSNQAVDIGEFPSYSMDWYDKRRDPNEECPECFGEGVGEVHFGDTRKLSAGAMALYNGVKVTKDGIEIMMANREKVIDQLAKVLGMFKEKESSVTVNIMAPENLKAMFWDRMEKARRRQQEVDAERNGLVIEGGTLDTGTGGSNP